METREGKRKGKGRVGEKLKREDDDHVYRTHSIFPLKTKYGYMLMKWPAGEPLTKKVEEEVRH